MALPASDTFTSASDQALTTYSSSWTNNAGAFQVLGATDDVKSNTSSNETCAHWNADTFANNQYAQVTVKAISGDTPMGPAVRCHASANTYYGFYGDSTASYLFKVVSGSWTQIGSNGSAVAVNDVLKLTVSGTTLTPTKNGSTTGTPGAQTDSSISSGYAGICGYHNSAARLDNWEGGNLSTTQTLTPTGVASTLAVGQGCHPPCYLLIIHHSEPTKQAANPHALISLTK